MPTRTKILLAELNEITWDLIDPLIAQGKLPTFARIKREGAWASPTSVDLPPQLDPWITWTTVYTGRSQEDHNVFFLEQPPETIRAPRIWELCHEQGLRVGVYASLCSWPPQPVNGFYVPDTFAPDTATYPEALHPIQDLNLTYTRSIRLPTRQDGLWFKARLGVKLLKLGLSASTMTRVARHLAQERRDPALYWRRVSLQPMINFDFFSSLYRRWKPEFATFHTNHVAHYMHTYWRAMEPSAFSEAPSEEVRKYSGAIEHGYRTADELLKRMLDLLDGETVLVVASSMGQKPFISQHKQGRAIGQFRSLDQIVDLLGVKGQVRALATMSDQFNLYPDTPAIKELAANRLESVYIETPGEPLFRVRTIDDALTVNLKVRERVTDDARCYFPHLGDGASYRYGDLVYNTGLVKSGCHDPKGMLMFFGPGIRPGGHIAECNNLDIAPTLLTQLGLPLPAEMKGRVLREAFI